MGKLDIKIGTLELKNPVILASGTAGYGKELGNLIDINRLGAIVTKTITLNKREGNAPPRVIETPGGLLNSIGLANDGLKDFMFEKAPFLEKLKIPAIASIAGNSLGEFIELAKKLSSIKNVQGIEINLSCPNVVHKGTKYSLLAQDPKAVGKIVAAIRKVTKRTLIAKLSPNVTSIQDIAKQAEANGVDAVSLVNTYSGMAVDVDTKRPKLGGITGGLSGPCIKPLALKCVWETCKAVKIPIIGMGGIMNARDAIEFLLSGASAVQVGTANFVNPHVSLEIIDGIKEYLKKNKVGSLKSLIGELIVGEE